MQHSRSRNPGTLVVEVVASAGEGEGCSSALDGLVRC